MLPPVPTENSRRSLNPTPGECARLRIPTALEISDYGDVVVNGTEYDTESTPPEQPPFTPFVFADTTAPTGVTRSTPRYSTTAITALDGALLSTAVTTLADVADLVTNTDIPV